MANYNSDYTGAQIDSAVSRANSTDVTAGTVAASKAVVVDSNKDITGFRHITATGTVTAANVSLTGNVDLGDASGDTVTITGSIDSNLIPATDDTYDIGSATYAWQDLFLEGDITFSDAGTIATTAGDLTINAGSGEIQFGNENLTLTGTIDSGSQAVTGNVVASGTVQYGSLSDGAITITAFESSLTSGAALVPTSAAVKTYVDAQVTAQDLDFSGDSGGALNIDLDSESLTFTGGTGVVTVGSGNTMTFNSVDSEIVHDSLSGFVANEHIDHTSVTLTAGVGLSGGGTIAADRTFTVDLNELTTETSIADADFIAMVDATDDGSGKITFENLEDAIFASVSGDVLITEAGVASIQANSVALTTDTTGDYVQNITAGTGLTSTGATSGENIAHSLSVDASQAQVTTVGTLNAGAISSGFGAIDIGSSNLTTTGTVSLGATSFTGAIDFNSQNMTEVDIDSGTIDGATIATSNVTVGSGKTLDVSAGTLTLAANQISGDKVEGGTIAATTITTLTTAGITASANLDIGSYDLRAATITPDGLTSGRVVFAGTNGVLSDDSDLTFSGSTLSATNVAISGTLTTTGSVQEVSTTNLNVEDPLILLNKYDSQPGNNVFDAGIVIKRGSSDSAPANVAMIWDETADTFSFVDTSEDGTTAGNVSITDYENLRVGALTADDASTFTSTISAATGSTIGDLTLANGSITSSGAAISFGSENLSTSGTLGAGVITATGLTIGSAVITEAELEILDGASLSTTELNYVDGVTSAIQTQIDTKAPLASPTFTGTITIGSAGISETELEILDGLTVTTTEVNIMDGNTSATSTTVVDADRVVFNDGGTMKQVAVTDLSAYFDDEITAMPNLVTVSALNSGSITSGFGTINNGASTITTTGTVSTGALTVGGNIDFNSGTIDLSTQTVDVTLNAAVDALNFDSNTLSIDASNNRVGIGTASPVEPLHLATQTSNVGQVIQGSYDANANPMLSIRKSNGSIASPTAITSGHVQGMIRFEGYDGNSYHTSADIYSVSSGTVADGRVAGDLVFRTAPDSVAGLSERMRITSAGNVGIGVVAPQANLHVNDDTASSEDAGVLLLSNYDTSFSDTTGLGQIHFGGTRNNTHWGVGAMISAEAAEAWDADNEYGTDMFFRTAAIGASSTSVRMSILSSGNVGIGTAAPTAQLSLVSGTYGFENLFGLTDHACLGLGLGPGSTSNQIRTVIGTTYGMGLMHTASATAGSAKLQVVTTAENSTAGAVPTRLATFLADGNVGIGTDSPSAPFHLSKTTAGGEWAFRVDNKYNSSNDVVIEMGYANTSGRNSGFGISMDDTTATEYLMNLSSGGTSRFRVTGDGNVGIGTASPTAGRGLHVKSTGAGTTGRIENSHASTPYGPEFVFSGGSPDNETQYYLFCNDSSANRFIIYSSGDTWSSDGGAINSDNRLKENIVTATSKLDDINALKVRNFNWRQTDSETGETIHSSDSASKKRIGFIAQEFETVFPNLVNEHNQKNNASDDDPVMRKAIKHTALIPILVKAIQELSAKIETLETKVIALENA